MTTRGILAWFEETCKNPSNKITLLEWFEKICETPSDNNEHCPTLRALAEECDHITEFGVMFGKSTVSFLMARPDALVSYDIKKQEIVGFIEELAAKEQINFVFKLEDSRTTTIDETDLLYIDTDHTYEQLRTELFRHGDKARKYIILHDTDACPEMWPAVEEFVGQGSFRIKERRTNNYGLTILERVS